MKKLMLLIAVVFFTMNIAPKNSDAKKREHYLSGMFSWPKWKTKCKHITTWMARLDRNTKKKARKTCEKGGKYTCKIGGSCKYYYRECKEGYKKKKTRTLVYYCVKPCGKGYKAAGVTRCVRKK